MFHVSDVDYTDKLFDFDAHNEVDLSSDDSGFEKEGVSFFLKSYFLAVIAVDYLLITKLLQ